MSGKNQVILVGNLGKDAETRGAEGKVVALSLATSSSRKVGNEWQSETEWHHVVCFGKAAEAAKRFKKGDQIFAEGKLQTRQWQDQQSGQTKSRTQVTAFLVYKIDAMKVTTEVDTYAPPEEAVDDIDDDIPF